MIQYITLDRPEVFNSFNKTMALRVQQELDAAEVDSAVRAVVISGQGKAFCAGQDLGEIIDPEGPGMEAIIAEHYNPIIRKIRSLSKPVVAAVNGVAAGAGANIALACDIVIASENAVFIQAFSKIGLIPDSGGTFFLPRLVGFQRAAALMMLGDKVTATEAEEMGMIYSTVPHDQLEEHVAKIASKLANMPTKALALTKELLNQSTVHSLDEQLTAELHQQLVAGNTEDYKEGVSAFLEKRKPQFHGK